MKVIVVNNEQYEHDEYWHYVKTGSIGLVKGRDSWGNYDCTTAVVQFDKSCFIDASERNFENNYDTQHIKSEWLVPIYYEGSLTLVKKLYAD